jgi:uncharacterized protein (TIGR00369 family)
VTQARERTVGWEDPAVFGPWFEQASGLQVVRALVTGELPPPPVFALLGMRIVEAEDGRVTAQCDAGEYLYNLASVVHGGISATLIDTTTALAVRSTLAAGARMTSIELKLNFLRPLTVASGVLHAMGRVVHRGRRICVAEGTVASADGKVAAMGSASIAIL